MASREEFIESLHELIADDPTMIRGSEEEIIYQIDDLTLYGGFEMGRRGVDHKNLRPDGVSWENIFEWGTVVVPEAHTYISNFEVERFERMGFQKLPTDSNHLVNYKEGQTELIETEYESKEQPKSQIPAAFFSRSNSTDLHNTVLEDQLEAKTLKEKPNMFEQRKAAAIEKNKMIENNSANLVDHKNPIDTSRKVYKYKKSLNT